MKLNRFIALALIALLAVGAMGAFTYRSFAKGANQNAQQTTNCVEDDDANEAPDAADTDNIEEQCGDQVEDGQPDGTEADETRNVEDGNEANEVGGVDATDETAPANTPITADEAQALAEEANPGAGTLAVEYDVEGGHNIWEVELDNGLDVKVDADTGEILYTETRN